MTLRVPAVAGSFYPGSEGGVAEQMARFDVTGQKPRPVHGLVAPHAGYVYSGQVAANVFAAARLSDTLILIGPNHRGAGSSFPPPAAALVSEGAWLTPGGSVEIRSDLAALLLAESELLVEDSLAHAQEHSLEVQIPFLFRTLPTARIVPIILSRISSAQVTDLAAAIVRAITTFGRKVTLLASTDFTHYQPDDVARKQDHRAIEKIVALDGPGLMQRVERENISMCGDGATATVIEACKTLGATGAELIAYQTSGDITGDRSSVVGYGGLIIF